MNCLLENVAKPGVAEVYANDLRLERISRSLIQRVAVSASIQRSNPP